MVTKEKRRPSALTLADKSAALKRLIIQEFYSKSPVSGTGSLPAVVTAPLPAQLPAAGDAASRLGRPLDLKRAARLIGCSPWTVRQKLIPLGLPHVRFGASGKLIFYETQIIRWIETKQTEGGKPR